MRSSHATFWLDVKKYERDDLHQITVKKRKEERIFLFVIILWLQESDEVLSLLNNLTINYGKLS